MACTTDPVATEPPRQRATSQTKANPISGSSGEHACPRSIDATMRRDLRVPYGLRRVPLDRLAALQPMNTDPQMGDIVVASVEKIGKNTRIELANGRPCTLHVGDLVATVFGNRYATMQFEGYARANGSSCDLMSMGGLCGLVESRHAAIQDSSKLSILGQAVDAEGVALRLQDFALTPATSAAPRPSVLVVCGSSMDAGKTYTAASLITGLRKVTERVVGIKLTGTASGRDSWTMLDAGALTVFDFVDGGYPSTYLVGLSELLALHKLLIEHAAAREAEWVVMEIADGLLQGETAALLQSPAFTRAVDAWIFAAGDPLAAVSGLQILRGWGIRPFAISGRMTMGPLSVRETATATGVRCFTAAELQAGHANPLILATTASKPSSVAGRA
jgi:hypothetical protein